MDSIQFIERYPTLVKQIQEVIRPELFSIIDDLLEMEPHDLVTPETWFPNENSAYGFVWRLFMDKVGSCG
jgi:hypothetical protein